MAEDREIRDAAFVLTRMNGFRCGVYPHTKTRGFEVKVSRRKDEFDENPDPSTMKLNYRLTDYDLSYIAQLRAMPKDEMICKLRSEAKADFRGCARGLVPQARDDLEHAIRRRQSEM